MLQRGSLRSGQHAEPALTTSRKPVLLDWSRPPGALATAHRSGTYNPGRGVASMDEQALRGLIADVKGGKLSRRAFVQTDGRARPDRADGERRCSTIRGVAQAQSEVPATSRPSAAAAAPLKVLWWQGADAAQPALRRRHQGPGRLAHLLRAAGRLGPATATSCPILAAEIPSRAERRPRRGRHVGHLEAQAGREVARRQAVHRRRRASSTGNTPPTRRPPPSPSAATRTSRSRRSTTTPSASSSTSRRRSGPTPSSACAA